jgi:hypothetical protein
MIGLRVGRNAASHNFLFIANSLRANLKMATKYVDIFNFPFKVLYQSYSQSYQNSELRLSLHISLFI